ncbi:MAG TPA: peptide ABC transporter substrate-binding protein [Candidatus Acidoferrales bacterium]|nr:peptide ABC transporter substrate-binding protein [Candidatus Acidoferrales bacterium]
MTRNQRFRALAVLAGAFWLALACGGGGGGTSEELAPDQTLNFPLVDDVGDLDPGAMSAAVDIDIFRNVYSGLYKFDDSLKEIPDIAKGQPDISADGLTYTFHMKNDVKFSNGDPVKADDFIFSWNRAAAKQGDYASVFEPVKGYKDVEDGKSQTLSGLSKIDDFNFKATLSKPAGYWFTEVALWTAWVVNTKVVKAAGKDTDSGWAEKPDTAIGTGAFKMTARTPKQSIDFVPNAKYYGGSTGPIKRVHIEIVADQKAQLTKYESGGYSLIGYANQAPTPEDIIRYQNDPKLKKELTLQSSARTTWIGFNFKTGPFAGIDAGKNGRKAFSLAVDRAQLVDIACAKGATCQAATGGVITKGLKGYLGDGKDPNAKFDASQAKSLYQQWDPNGAKVKGLTYSFNSSATNKAVGENLQSQWKSNLGVNVSLSAADRATFFKTRSKCAYTIFRHSWGADYDHPQDWFDFLFVTGGGSAGTCYSNPQLDKLVQQANQKPLDAALSDYNQASQIMIDDVQYGGLFYGVQPYVVHSYVKGVGGNALYDYYWSEIKILKH